MNQKSNGKTSPGDAIKILVRRHFVIGWAGMAIYMIGGLALEALHGLKVSSYLDVGNEVRRLMWTLAHAHGTLFSLIHLAFATYVSCTANSGSKTLERVSFLATLGLLLLPLGFFLGGLWLLGGDPGIGIFLVPLGAICMIAAMIVLAVHALKGDPKPHTDSTQASTAEKNPDASRRGAKKRKK